MSEEATFWNKAAAGYSRKPVADPEAFDRKIDLTLARMKPGDVVLDIGCGTGSLALRLAPSGAQVHGLDVSSEMIRIAREKAAAQHVENVAFHVGLFDETFTTFEDGGLDGLCAYSILHLLSDRQAALAQIHRLLQPGGFFISSTVVLGESKVPFRPLLWLMRKLKLAPKVSIFDKKTLEEEIGAAGFVDVSEPDVGAQPTVAFLVARKPGS